LLEVALRLVAVSLRFELLVAGGAPDGLLGLAAELLELVIHLLVAAHRILPLSLRRRNTRAPGATRTIPPNG
jgi:hypothetical protein